MRKLVALPSQQGEARSVLGPLRRSAWKSDPRTQRGDAVTSAPLTEHLDPFLRTAAEASEGRGLPQFVEREFRDFLLCGLFEQGVARFRCEGCAEHVVPFSCKGRGF
jgi:hypothetical protein